MDPTGAILNKERGCDLIKNDLVEAIRHQLGGLSSREILEYVTFIFDEIAEALGRGETVKITNFGVFEPHDKKARMGRNPKTLEEAEISARRVVRFRMSENVFNALNLEESSKNTCFSDEEK